jgi:hypothetical protein
MANDAFIGIVRTALLGAFMHFGLPITGLLADSAVSDLPPGQHFPESTVAQACHRVM